jgi:hypothetical protein
MYRPYTLGSGNFAAQATPISGHYYRRRRYWMAAVLLLLVL